MSVIKHIVLHHTGGARSNDYASTRHHTFDTINDYHAARWRSERHTWPAYTSKLGHQCGYNVVYDAKTRTFRQARMIGEETAAARGRNFDSFHLCIIGNYNTNPTGSGTVDPLERFMVEDIVSYLDNLINGNTRGVQVASGTTLDLSVARVHPHREFSSTLCYGTGIPDTYFRDQLVKYGAKDSTALQLENKKLRERNALLKTYLKFYIRVYNALKGNQRAVGAERIDDWREDPERIDQV